MNTKEKSQILIVHGGRTFRNKKKYQEFLEKHYVSLDYQPTWAVDYFDRIVSDEYEIIRPQMPHFRNAQYENWKIYFEKYISLLEDNITLIGISLGGIFLAQYLSENKYPKNIKALYLVCAPFDDTLPHEDLCNGFEITKNANMLLDNCQNIKLLFSSDDQCVPVQHAHKYKAWLPSADLHIFDDKNGHFQVTQFPEIIEMLQEDLK